jgi:hypothetical protein
MHCACPTIYSEAQASKKAINAPDAKGKGKARADAVTGEIITSVFQFNAHHASEVEMGFVEKDEYNTDEYEIKDDESMSIIPIY